MSQDDLQRLKSDASGNTGLSEALAEAVPGFASPKEAVEFLAARGFEISSEELADAAIADSAAAEAGEDEGGYGVLLQFIRDR